MNLQKKITFKGVDLYYYDLGEGPCIVLLHGYLESGAIWQSFTENFPGACRFIVPDLPGHGASGVWGKVHSMEDLAGAVHSILEEEGIAKVFLAGHSMGGYVSMAFAGLYPEKLSAYSLVHSTPFADTIDKKDNREREIALVMCGKKRQIVLVNIPRAFAMDNLETMATQVDLAKQIALTSPDDGIIALLNGMKERSDRCSVLQDTGLPLLIIGGMKDNYIPLEVIDRMETLAPHARVLRLDRSGHMGFMEEPQPIYKAFLEMLSLQ